MIREICPGHYIMGAELTREESAAIRGIHASRFLNWLILVTLTVLLVLDLLLVLNEAGSGGGASDVPEWLLIPIAAGFVILAVLFSLVFSMALNMKFREHARFVLASTRSLTYYGLLSKRQAPGIFIRLAHDLVTKTGGRLIRELIAEGWHPVRANHYAGLIRILLARTEWNINYEDQVAEHAALLNRLKFSEHEISIIVGPVVETIMNTGGRLNAAAVSGSILKNVVWIIVILAAVPLLIWMLFTNDYLDASTKYDFIQVLVFAVPLLIVIGYNIYSIVRKLNRRNNRQ